MDFFQAICLLCPAAIPTMLESKKENKLLVYMIYVMIINLFNTAIVYFVFKHEALTFTPAFTIKYIGLGILNGIICYLVKLVLNKYCSIELKLEKETKISEKKNVNIGY